MRDFQEELVIFTAKGATGTGLAHKVEDFQHVLLTLSSASNANFTIKFQASNSDSCPDFSAAQSVANRWDYIQVKDLQSGSAIAGDTGVAFAGTDDVRLFEVNSSGQTWICATITARSAGTVTLTAKPFSNG
jgi:hypothetical protein